MPDEELEPFLTHRSSRRLVLSTCFIVSPMLVAVPVIVSINMAHGSTGLGFRLPPEIRDLYTDASIWLGRHPKMTSALKGKGCLPKSDQRELD